MLALGFIFGVIVATKACKERAWWDMLFRNAWFVFGSFFQTAPQAAVPLKAAAPEPQLPFEQSALSSVFSYMLRAYVP